MKNKKWESEWYKEKRTGNVWRLVLSGFMFFQSYMYRDLPYQIFEIDLIFLFSHGLFSFSFY